MRLNWGTAPVSLFQILELVLVLLSAILAFVRPSLGTSVFLQIEAYLIRISRKPWLCMLIVFVFPITLRLSLLPVYGVPAPIISDEYAYLLQSDTFASGRLTNPAPPLPQHFDSVYLLTQPTYTAEYQPGQGLALAAGQALTKEPWTGVLLSMGVLCALTYWALLAWLPSVWAFTGTLAVVDISIGVLSYWLNSYWGGCVPAIGGALVLGALPRVLGRHPVSHAMLTGAGLFILFNSRPLEAVFLSLVVAGALFCWTFRTGELSVSRLAARILPALAVAAVAVISFAGYYNSRITGRPSQFPYLLYRTEYGLPQGFFWQKSVLVNTSAMPSDIRSEYEDQLRQHERRGSFKGLLGATGGKLRRFWDFYIGAPFTTPLLFLPFIWRAPRMQLVLWTLVTVLCVDNLTFFAYFPHYSAAVTVAIVLVLVACVRHLRNSGEAGLFLSRALPLVCLIGLAFPMTGRFTEDRLPAPLTGLKKLWQSEFGRDLEREAFTPRLRQEVGRQLVFVRYAPYDGRKKFEWIYNQADLSSAKIVWARYSEDPTSNKMLVGRFPSRKLWLAEPDATPPRVSPYDLPVISDPPR